MQLTGYSRPVQRLTHSLIDRSIVSGLSTILFADVFDNKYRNRIETRIRDGKEKDINIVISIKVIARQGLLVELAWLYRRR